MCRLETKHVNVKKITLKKERNNIRCMKLTSKASCITGELENQAV